VVEVVPLAEVVPLVKVVYLVEAVDEVDIVFEVLLVEVDVVVKAVFVVPVELLADFDIKKVVAVDDVELVVLLFNELDPCLSISHDRIKIIY
jgi:hypothetical protein